MHNENHACPLATPPSTPAPKPIPGAAFLLKTCRTCGQERPLRSFYKQRGCADQRRPDCIPCLRAAAAERRAAGETVPPPERRWCRHCRKSYPIEAFPLDRRYRAGYAHICQVCADRLATQEESARERLNCQDKWIPQFSPLREERIDLGIAIAHATCPPGHCRSREELAAYTGLTVEAVRRIELRALWKMRKQARKILAELGLEAIMQEGIRL